mmetsp:Transcript_889/g.1532  ORF Transcript_889/g.1532 Transcript_889/m.1532 type:complete len:263 (-) Transcript_889:6002-6790(-)
MTISCSTASVMTKYSCENPILEGAHIENYDPSHPDADWSGFVSSRSQRKHIPCQPNQLCALNSCGLGPKENVNTADWTKPARKIVQGAPCVENDKPHSIRSSTFSLIGGPVPLDSPNLYSPGWWETETQAAARKRKTDLQQLTVQGRSKYIKGKKSLSAIEGKFEVNDVQNVKSQPCSGMNDVSQVPGFRSRSTKLKFSDPIYLKGVCDAMEKLRPPDGPFAIDVSAPFDPYRTATGERRKDLLVENFRSVVPGYNKVIKQY